jgi:hypothetical protein
MLTSPIVDFVFSDLYQNDDRHPPPGRARTEGEEIKWRRSAAAGFSLKEDRQLIQMAATSAKLEEAAAIFRTSVDTIENKCKRLGIQLRRRGRKRPIRRLVGLGLKGKK